MSMDVFCFVDDENRGAEGNAKKKEVYLARNRPPNVTNKSKVKSHEKLRHIVKLQKENITLERLLEKNAHDLEETDKLLEFTELELTKLRRIIPKLQLQNRLLAQANSQMAMDHTLYEESMRAMEHELRRRRDLLAAKDMELQKSEGVTMEATVTDGCGDTAKDTREEINEEPVPDAKPNWSYQSKIQSSMKEQVVAKVKPKTDSNQIKGDPVQAHIGDMKAHKFDMSLLSITQSLGSSDVKEGVMVKEKPKSKRLCPLMQSASSKSEQGKLSADDFPKEHARFPPSHSLSDKNMQVVANSAMKTVKEPKDDWNHDTPGLRTSSGRPLRRAAGKVQSYKEIPVKIKMRRPE